MDGSAGSVGRIMARPCSGAETASRRIRAARARVPAHQLHPATCARPRASIASPRGVRPVRRRRGPARATSTPRPSCGRCSRMRSAGPELFAEAEPAEPPRRVRCGRVRLVGVYSACSTASSGSSSMCSAGAYRRARPGSSRARRAERCGGDPPGDAARGGAYASVGAARAEVLVCGAASRGSPSRGSSHGYLHRMCLSSTATRSASARPPRARPRHLAPRDGGARGDPQELPSWRSTPRTGRPARLRELVGVRLPHALPRAVGPGRRPLRGRQGRGAIRDAGVATEDRGRRIGARCWSLTRSAGGVLGRGRTCNARRADLARPRGTSRRARRRHRPRRLDRPSLIRSATLVGPRCRGAARRRRLLRAARPRQGADARDRRAARRAARPLPGHWFPRAAPGSRGGRFAGDSAGLLPLLGARGSGRRSTSASPAGASCAACSRASDPRGGARRVRRVLRLARAGVHHGAAAPARDSGAAAPRADRTACGDGAPAAAPARVHLVPRAGAPALRGARRRRRSGCA